jgi:hypothetical protein
LIVAILWNLQSRQFAGGFFVFTQAFFQAPFKKQYANSSAAV